MRSALSFLIAYVGLFGVAQAQDIAIANATVYTSPGAAAQPHTTVLIQGGKIVAVGNGVSVPSSVQTLSCRGCVADSLRAIQNDADALKRNDAETTHRDHTHT